MIDPRDPFDAQFTDAQLEWLDGLLLEDEAELSDEQLADELGVELPEAEG